MPHRVILFLHLLEIDLCRSSKFYLKYQDQQWLTGDISQALKGLSSVCKNIPDLEETISCSLLLQWFLLWLAGPPGLF